MQQMKHDIQKIADEIEANGYLEMYCDYNDKLSEEQIMKIILEEDGLDDIQMELWDWNIDYISDTVREAIQRYCKEKEIELDDEEQDDLRMECESRFKFDIDGLLKNSSADIRVQLNTNEDMIRTEEGMHNETVQMFRKRFKGKFRIKDLQKEIDNCTCDYANFNFYFKILGKDILELRKQVKEGYILLRKGLFFGLFDNVNGSGSVLEILLLGDVKLCLKDWRIRDNKEEVMRRLVGETSNYYNASIIGDSKKYGIQQTYGLARWQEW